ncbi:sugar phosphate nucleotidyltransferase [Paenibacillus sp. GP183]|uniref:sugar phosphate nucleotidyltransferase n=1 Tax=Paenibacillus sp. GP183 TaxID=1882751 RepID=UPI00089CC9D6|nr:sugar phosphate nucleotidyltransferase [Paenibacillus sp. GP183]SEC11079.1 mannose-1-phosphate guanylyltransferase [Paenibacillus sp. GP183]
MKFVLLSGGSGKRLWPLSNDARSKQFLKILENKNKVRESMVQRVWGQLKSMGLSDSAVVATSKAQVDIIQNQLGHHVPLVVEPERRDTFPAIALASVYLYSIEGASLDEVVCILPVDPFVEDTFFNQIKVLESVLQSSGADVALMGVNPTYPSSKYGYIIPHKNEKQQGTYVSVSHFIEKPTEEQAEELIRKQALWNCGVFAFKLDYIISLLIEKGLSIQYEELLKNYKKLPNISFDYEVVEKANHIVTLPYGGYWKDLGTWNTLTEQMAAQVIGKAIISEDSVNTHVINELDLPIIVLGLPNTVVAASPDGILVTEKSASPRIKDLLGTIDQRPMYEERRWGWYRVLDYTRFGENREVLTKRIGVKSGCNLSYQLHYKRCEVWTIVNGEGEFVLDDKIYPVKAGDVLQIPVEAKHGIKALTDLEFIEVQAGTDLIEDDIVRIFMTWEEIENHCLSKK